MELCMGWVGGGMMEAKDVLFGPRWGNGVGRERPDLVCNECPVIDRCASALTCLSGGCPISHDADRLVFVFPYTSAVQLIFPPASPSSPLSQGRRTDTTSASGR